jgi:hypothetical protein
MIDRPYLQTTQVKKGLSIYPPTATGSGVEQGMGLRYPVESWQTTSWPQVFVGWGVLFNVSKVHDDVTAATGVGER